MSPTEHGFGSVLKRLRERRGRTQAAIAEAVGVERATISQWEGGRHLPSAERAQALDDVLEADGELVRLAARGRGAGPSTPAAGPIPGGPHLLSVFRQVEGALLDKLQRTQADHRPKGWCHNLQNDDDPPTAVSTAFGVKAVLLIEAAVQAELGPLARTFHEMALADGGWKARAQTASRPEAIAVVTDALVRLEPTTDVSPRLHLLEERLDEIALQRPSIMATVLDTVLDLRPQSDFSTKLVRSLLASRQESGRHPLVWSQKKDPRLVDPEPSIVHTARAVSALARGRSEGSLAEEVCDEVDEAIAVAVEWLLARSGFENTTEPVERIGPDGRQELLSLRHFASAWVARALLLANVPASHPTVAEALRELWSHYNPNHSLWRWSTGDLPVWMTFDAVATLRLAALASFHPGA